MQSDKNKRFIRFTVPDDSEPSGYSVAVIDTEEFEGNQVTVPSYERRRSSSRRLSQTLIPGELKRRRFSSRHGSISRRNSSLGEPVKKKLTMSYDEFCRLYKENDDIEEYSDDDQFIIEDLFDDDQEYHIHEKIIELDPEEMIGDDSDEHFELEAVEGFSPWSSQVQYIFI